MDDTLVELKIELAHLSERLSAGLARVTVIDTQLREGEYVTRRDHEKLSESVKNLFDSRSVAGGERGVIEKLIPLLGWFLFVVLTIWLGLHR